MDKQAKKLFITLFIISDVIFFGVLAWVILGSSGEGDLESKIQNAMEVGGGVVYVKEGESNQGELMRDEYFRIYDKEDKWLVQRGFAKEGEEEDWLTIVQGVKQSGSADGFASFAAEEIQKAAAESMQERFLRVAKAGGGLIYVEPRVVTVQEYQSDVGQSDQKAKITTQSKLTQDRFIYRLAKKGNNWQVQSANSVNAPEDQWSDWVGTSVEDSAAPLPSAEDAAELCEFFVEHLKSEHESRRKIRESMIEKK